MIMLGMGQKERNVMCIGKYHVGVDCNGDLYEWEDEEREMTALDRDFNDWLSDMEDCDPIYDEPIFAFA